MRKLKVASKLPPTMTRPPRRPSRSSVVEVVEGEIIGVEVAGVVEVEVTGVFEVNVGAAEARSRSGVVEVVEGEVVGVRSVSGS